MSSNMCKSGSESAESIVAAHQEYKLGIEKINSIIDSLEVKEYKDDLTKQISQDIVTSLRKTTRSFNADDTKKPFVIACCGQVKAGKSYFLSEILRGAIVLPSEDLPCTRRCIRIYFNQNKIYRLNKLSKNENGTFTEEPLSEPKPFDKVKDIRNHIVLTEEEIQQKETFMILVEIGVPSELLSSGIQFVDTPGLNEPLQNLSQSVNSVLSFLKPNILLYIFDYRETFSMKDCTRLDSVCKSLRGNNYKLILVANKVDTDTEAAERDGNQVVSDKPYDYKVEEVINDRMRKWFPRITEQQAFPLSTLKLRDHRLDTEDCVEDEMKDFLEFQKNLEKGLREHMHGLIHDLIEICVFDWRIIYLLSDSNERLLQQHKSEINRSMDSEAEKWEKHWPVQDFLADIEEIITKVSDMKRPQFEGIKLELKAYFNKDDIKRLNDDEELMLIRKIVELNIITDFIEARCFEIIAYSYTRIRENAFHKMECIITCTKALVVSSLMDIKCQINQHFKDIKDEFIKEKSSSKNLVECFSKIDCKEYVDRIKEKEPISFLAKKFSNHHIADEYVEKVQKAMTHPSDDLKVLKESIIKAKEDFTRIIKTNKDCQVKCKLQLKSLDNQQ